MNVINEFLSKNIKVTAVSEAQLDNINGLSEAEEHPIVALNNILKKIRTNSKKTVSVHDEMKIAIELKNELSALQEKLKLPKDQFEIDISGNPLVVSSKKGQHFILPTHFEAGAYLSSPHYDHELNFDKTQVPKIHIGKYTRLGKGAAINAGADIFIGDYVWLAPDSVLLRQEHSAYGEPSIGARTVNMTRQPPIYISDYAWLGRGAIVGWNCEYVGKGSIVGLKSVVNKWIGDFSIVGDHSKILDYLPYKAYFINTYKPTLSDLLKLGDWNKIYEKWQKVFSDNIDKFPEEMIADDSLQNLKKQDEILFLGLDNPKILTNFIGNKVDIFVEDDCLIPYLLEISKRNKSMTTRSRVVTDFSKLPLDNANKSFGRTTGYKFVIIEADNIDKKELLRVTQRDALLLIREGNEKPFLSDFEYQRCVLVGKNKYILLKRV